MTLGATRRRQRFVVGQEVMERLLGRIKVTGIITLRLAQVHRFGQLLVQHLNRVVQQLDVVLGVVGKCTGSLSEV